MKSISHHKQLAREAKAEGCGHENADHLMPGESSTVSGVLDGHIAKFEQFRCVDCGAWLSFGPSNDKPSDWRVRDAVAIEISAARIAQGLVDDDDFEWDRYESDGWVDWSYENSRPSDDDAASADHWHSGFLARQIAEHDGLPVSEFNHDAEQAETGGEG